jgi:hypothetical protein
MPKKKNAKKTTKKKTKLPLNELSKKLLECYTFQRKSPVDIFDKEGNLYNGLGYCLTKEELLLLKIENFWELWGERPYFVKCWDLHIRVASLIHEAMAENVYCMLSNEVKEAVAFPEEYGIDAKQLNEIHKKTLLTEIKFKEDLEQKTNITAKENTVPNKPNIPKLKPVKLNELSIKLDEYGVFLNRNNKQIGQIIENKPKSKLYEIFLNFSGNVTQYFINKTLATRIRKSINVALATKGLECKANPLRNESGLKYTLLIPCKYNSPEVDFADSKYPREIPIDSMEEYENYEKNSNFTM